jgi:hypothetical protein
MTDVMSNSLMLIGATGDRPVHLIYGQETGDHQPFVLVTVTPEYVAHKISKPLPLDPNEFSLFIHDNAEDLMKIALSCRERGKTGAVLTAKLPEVQHNLICTLAHAKERLSQEKRYSRSSFRPREALSRCGRSRPSRIDDARKCADVPADPASP